jgi:predicted PurR-regulated permease PerM
MGLGQDRKLLFVVPVALVFIAFQLAQEHWANAASGAVMLALFAALVAWIRRHRPNQAPDPERVRRLSIRALPFFLIFFAFLAIFSVFHDDWFGTLYAGALFVGVSIALWINRHQLTRS